MGFFNGNLFSNVTDVTRFSHIFIVLQENNNGDGRDVNNEQEANENEQGWQNELANDEQGWQNEQDNDEQGTWQNEQVNDEQGWQNEQNWQTNEEDFNTAHSTSF